MPHRNKQRHDLDGGSPSKVPLMKFSGSGKPEKNKGLGLIVGTWATVVAVLTFVGGVNTDATYKNILVGESATFDELMGSSSTGRQPHLHGPLANWTIQVQESCHKMLQELGTTTTTTTTTTTESTLQQKRALEQNALSQFSQDSSAGGKFVHCKNVYLDLGSKNGETIGQFIDMAVDVCSPIWLESRPSPDSFPRPHLDLEKLKWTSRTTENPLDRVLPSLLSSSLSPSSSLSADSFCVYGVEGNPSYTESLQRLEHFVRTSHPRPVQVLKILSKTVIASKDGPTELAMDPNSKSKTTAVQGLSLSTLVRKAALSKESSLEGDGLLLIRMSMEGSEDLMLKDVASSNVLCDYIQQGNRVVIMGPLHSTRELEGTDAAQDLLNGCGVEFLQIYS